MHARGEAGFSFRNGVTKLKKTISSPSVRPPLVCLDTRSREEEKELGRMGLVRVERRRVKGLDGRTDRERETAGAMSKLHSLSIGRSAATSWRRGFEFPTGELEKAIYLAASCEVRPSGDILR